MVSVHCHALYHHLEPGRGNRARTHNYWKTFLNVPIPSISISISLPGFIGSAPGPVAQAITSPGNSVISADNKLTIWCGAKMRSLTR